RGSVWEVRTTLGNRIARTLFAVAHGQMVLLHGFIKKTSRTPGEEIDLAIKRFKEWQHGEM
ncbi:MAG: type II toxin-antitoxin system RelE/ParE family toxin, partial [Acidiferrobacteraceae bacterium]